MDTIETSDAHYKQPRNFAPSPDFKWLCDELFIKVDDAQRQIKERRASFKSLTLKHFETMSFFVKLWRKTVGNNIYPALVLILPYRDRRIFNIKDYTLIKAICCFLKLPSNSITERRLLRWKRRARSGIRLSDFCVEEIKKRRSEPLNKGRISIDKLNEYLDLLVRERNSKGRGFKSLADSCIFKYCLENMTFIEMKYFFDILLKSRPIGSQENKFLNCWNPDARDYLSVVSDLKTVADKLWDPNYRLKNEELDINLGLAFSPFLAKRLHTSYDKVAAKLKGDFYIEEKMDGERILLHYMKYGQNLKWFSRRGNDYSFLYGENVETGTVAKYLHLNPKVEECVLDGEMISFDIEANAVLPFGLVKSSARDALTAGDICTQVYRPLYMVMDLIYLNGVSLINVPLNVRKQYLSAILRPTPHAVEIICTNHCFEGNAIRHSLEKAIMMGSEGLILKQFKSRYEIGRRSDSWIKIKPEYLEEFGENLDLVVIGRDPGKKDSLMCGLAVLEGDEGLSPQPENQIVLLDPEEEEEEESRKCVKKFISFCTIANGLSLEEFKQIDRKTIGKWKKTEECKPPKTLEFGSKIPEEWIYPEDSVVLEVKARSLDNTESSRRKFKAGCTLYGGYCRRIRDDKHWTECYSSSDLRQERRKNATLPDNQTHQPNLRTKKSRRPLFSLNQTLCCNDEARSSVIFDRLVFYVISDYLSSEASERISKEEICSLISRNGGKLTFGITSNQVRQGDLRIISGKYTLECKALMERGYDILTPQWIIDCVKSDSLIGIEPRHCFSVSEEMERIARTKVDDFGDAYNVELTEARLKEIIKTNEFHSDLPTKSLDLMKYEEDIPLFLFSRRIAYIPEEFSYLETQLIRNKIKLYGGELTGSVEQCNLIIIPNGDQGLRKHTINHLQGLLSTFVNKTTLPPAIPRIVIPAWIDESIRKCCQVPEEDFLAM